MQSWPADTGPELGAVARMWADDECSRAAPLGVAVHGCGELGHGGDGFTGEDEHHPAVGIGVVGVRSGHVPGRIEWG